MPYIRQEDIVDALFSKDFVDTYKINPGAELDASIVADPYALGFGLDNTSPLQIKQNNPGANTNWDDEQDITFHNVDYDESGPFYDVDSGSATFQMFNGESLDLGNTDIVGIYGGPGIWTSLGINSALNTNRSGHGGAGTYNAVTVVGGANTAGTTISSTEFFNGTNFSTASALNVSKTQGFSFGSSYAMVYGSGIDGGGGYISNTSFFNGNSWVASTDTVILQAGASAFGSFHAAYLKSGKTSAPAFNGSGYYFNGETWAGTFNSIFGFTTAYSASTGSVNNGVIAGGVDSGGTTLSFTNVFNGLTFSLGGNLAFAVNKGSMSGLATSAIMTCGENGALLSATQLYNGHLWTVAGSANYTRSFHTSGGSAINATIHGNSNIAASNFCESYNQSIYRKITPEFINTVGNPGVSFNFSVPAVGKCSVKVSGFIKGLSAGTSFHHIVMSQYSQIGGGVFDFNFETNYPASTDYSFAKYDIVNTKLHVFSNFNKTYNIVKKWG